MNRDGIKYWVRDYPLKEYSGASGVGSGSGVYNGYTGDVDCADVNGPIWVGTNDANGFDGDGDGLGLRVTPW
jgi:hypothetical protein